MPRDYFGAIYIFAARDGTLWRRESFLVEAHKG
jgi:hypothetical protein